MQKQVHPCNGRGRKVVLLSVHLAVGGLLVVDVANGDARAALNAIELELESSVHHLIQLI